MIYHLSLNSRGRKNDSQYSSEIQAVIFLSKESIIPRKQKIITQNNQFKAYSRLLIFYFIELYLKIFTVQNVTPKIPIMAIR